METLAGSRPSLRGNPRGERWAVAARDLMSHPSHPRTPSGRLESGRLDVWTSGDSANLLHNRFGLQVTPGGLVHLLHRAARDARPTYEQSREQVRNAPVVTADETGWRVGARSHWLWAAVTPTTTVYAIRAGRGFDDAQAVMGADFEVAFGAWHRQLGR